MWMLALSLLVSASVLAQPGSRPYLGATVVLAREETEVTRVIVGVPGNKRLAQDEAFTIRAASSWAWWYDTVCWMSGADPSPWR